MPAAKSIRTQIFEAIRAGIVYCLDDDTFEWGLAEDGSSIVAEPNSSPQSETDQISVRILVYNAFSTGTTDLTNAELMVKDVESRLQLQAYGPRGWVWLETFLDMLDDEDVLEFFQDLGFAVYSDGAGISDLSAMVGAREQLRGVAYLTVACRAIRDRVMVEVDTIQVLVDTLQDSAGVLADMEFTVETDPGD